MKAIEELISICEPALVRRPRAPNCLHWNTLSVSHDNLARNDRVTSRNIAMTGPFVWARPFNMRLAPHIRLSQGATTLFIH
jgi:hypothetical protein